MMNAAKKADVWGATSYTLPKPYLRERTEKKDAGENKARFIQAPGDGPAYKVGKSERKRFFHLNVYGKDGKEPPHSYLPLKEWGGKKEPKKEEAKGDKKFVGSARNTFVDNIFFFGEKYKLPGPNAYFKEPGEKAKTAKKEEEGKEKKKFERVNFLCDAEYLGMNNPCPGSYNMKVGTTMTCRTPGS